MQEYASSYPEEQPDLLKEARAALEKARAEQVSTVFTFFETTTLKTVVSPLSLINKT